MIRYLTFYMVALASVVNGADQPKKRTTEAWYYKLARILGVDRAPVALKGPAAAKPGELWIGPADRADPRRLAEGSDFASPVFQPGGKYVFALRQMDLVRIPLTGGAPVKVRSLPGVIKLVGFDAGNADRVLVLFESAPNGNKRMLDIALVSVKTGKRQSVAERQAADSEEAESLLGWQRQYGNVFVRPEGADVVMGGIGPVETPVSDCQDAACGQPSYTSELHQVVYIRSGRLP